MLLPSFSAPSTSQIDTRMIPFCSIQEHVIISDRINLLTTASSHAPWITRGAIIMFLSRLLAVHVLANQSSSFKYDRWASDWRLHVVSMTFSLDEWQLTPWLMLGLYWMLQQH